MLELELASDFADIFAVKRVEDLGAPGIIGGGAVATGALAGRAHRRVRGQGFPARTLVHLDPAPDDVDGGAARYRLRLAPGERWRLGVAVQWLLNEDTGARRCRVRGWASRRSTRAGRVARCLVALGAAAARTGRSRARAHVGAVARGPGCAPAALGGERHGSGSRTAVVHDAVRPRHAHHVVPGDARSVPRRPPARCARSHDAQADTDDPERDAEPGKIVHELRRGKTALDLDRPLLRHGRRDAAVPRPALGAVALDRRRRDRARAGAARRAALSIGSTPSATATVTVSSSTCAARATASTTRTGRTRTTRWSSTTARSRARRSHPSRCRATSTTRSCAWQSSPGACGATRRRRCVSNAKRRRYASGSTRRSGFRTAAGTRSASTPTSGRSTRSRRTWAISCGAASSPPTASRRLPRSSSRDRSGPAGESARSPPTSAAFDPLEYHNGTVWPHDNSLIALGLAQAGRRMRGGARRARAPRLRALLRVPAAGALRRRRAATGRGAGGRADLCAAAGVGRRNAAAPAPRAARARAGPRIPALCVSRRTTLPAWLEGFVLDRIPAFGRHWRVRVENHTAIRRVVMHQESDSRREPDS